MRLAIVGEASKASCWFEGVAAALFVGPLQGFRDA